MDQFRFNQPLQHPVERDGVDGTLYVQLSQNFVMGKWAGLLQQECQDHHPLAGNACVRFSNERFGLTMIRHDSQLKCNFVAK